ncbi:hypothetical protein ACNJYD_12185 [Bradyrhizobium sp. DASA03005]|uniref:hypothetical protein n=1 Tax=Bradyrhizobium sp. SPXBL-02 TaxID=3395912 RepID=UPI003F6F1D1C
MTDEGSPFAGQPKPVNSSIGKARSRLQEPISLTRRAKHWQNSIIETSLFCARAGFSAAGFLRLDPKLTGVNFRRIFQMTEAVNYNLLSQNALARAAARRALKQRALTEIKSLARTHTNLAIKTLVQIMRDKDAPLMPG